MTRKRYSDDFKKQIVELEKDNRQFKMENDILKQAPVIMARK